jgi:septation ring formation regulator EzrA
MKEGEWEDGHVKGGPEDALETLLKSGYPWHMLGQRLKAVDQQMKTVTDEYGDIRDAIERVTADVTILRDQHAGTGDTVRRVLRDETASLQNRWLIGAGSLLLGAVE